MSTSSRIRIGLVQYVSPGPNTALALEQGEKAVRAAAAEGADIVLFPEMWQIGYASCPEEEPARSQWLGRAIDEDDEFIAHFASLARELEVAVVMTYLQRWPVAPRNAAVLIDRTGLIVGRYAKVHTCDYWMESELTPGDGFSVVGLDTRIGRIQVGMMICFDREFPESARVLMVKGAELVLVPNACHLSDDRIGLFRARSFENMMALAMANYTSTPQVSAAEYPLDLNGRSVAYSGVAYAPDRTPVDPTLVLAGPDEGVYYADVDVHALREFRAEEVWGDSYRKPRAYSALVADDPAPEFTRVDSRRVPRQEA